jgi:hypothetical protein
LTTIFGATIATIGFILSVFAKRLFILYITIGIVVGIGFGLVYVPAIVSVGKLILTIKEVYLNPSLFS